MDMLSHGIYERILDEELSNILKSHPELRSVFGKIDPEEEPQRYAAFLAKVLEKALRHQANPETRLHLCNELLSRITEAPETNFLQRRRMKGEEKSLLIEITPPNYATSGMPRPETSLTESSLFTGSSSEPQLVHELLQEMPSADGMDVLVSFIKWSGLRLLMHGLEELAQRGAQIRVITTSYMGASDAEAIEWIARLPNTSVRISYDTERTRLHAKAYHFKRNSEFSVAYIGSSNMSQPAMTSGLEWNLKVTAQDLPHIIQKFEAEFETYWNSREFVPFDPDHPQILRQALQHARSRATVATVFFDLRPHPFQERILDALESERLAHGHWRNLVVAATGTGKTVIAAFDFKRFFESSQRRARLLFVAHRQEILEQAVATFRAVLRTPDFGELMAGPHTAHRLDHLFCSVGMLESQHIYDRVEPDFYDFVIVDEVHHGPAASYRSIFNADKFNPKILLGLTATPERMDGRSVLGDFGNRFAAEIRLPEALEEKLLCPFQYFAVADPVGLSQDSFWRNGRYDITALEKVYTGDHALARQRVETIISSLTRFEPNLSRVHGIGFCVTVFHANFMAAEFNRRGVNSAVLVGKTDEGERSSLIEQLRSGQLTFLFTVDVLSEGLDIPDINTVLFLRPTESLTVFLQQLGRGLRPAPGKDCLTVLDLVGQAHRRYRIDRKFKALLSKTRFNIEREAEMNFPHLPAGCSIQMDRVSREYILANIRQNLGQLTAQVTERLQTFEQEANQNLTFGNFIRYHDYDPTLLLAKDTWSGWRTRAGQLEAGSPDPDIAQLRNGLLKAVHINGPREIRMLRKVISHLRQQNIDGALEAAESATILAHYRFWGKRGSDLGLHTIEESFRKLALNPTFLSDFDDVLDWTEMESRIIGLLPQLPFDCPLELHGQYGSSDLKAGLGLATMTSAGVTGSGVLHSIALRTYALLVTFQKTEHEFSPSTMYADYPVNRELLHWESQSNTTQENPTGQNLCNHLERNYTILLFARAKKKEGSLSQPFTYLGPATCDRYHSERPIQMVWKLHHPMPAAMFEENKRGG